MRRLALVLFAFVEVGCFNGIACNQINAPTPAPSGTPSPSPSPSATPVATNGCNTVFAVKIAQGGASCVIGAGMTLAPGCVLDVTATPLNALLEPVPISVHGPDIAWSGGGVVVSINNRGDNPFNRAIEALSSGSGQEWVVTATNCGRVGELRGRVS